MTVSQTSARNTVIDSIYASKAMVSRASVFFRRRDTGAPLEHPERFCLKYLAEQDGCDHLDKTGSRSTRSQKAMLAARLIWRLS